MAGTDTGFPFVIPGFGLHKELQYLGDSGLSPSEVLKIATLNAANYLVLNENMGSIEAGKLADLVVLDANPLINIKNLQLIHAVVANGKPYDRASLDSLLQEARSYSN